MENPENNNYEEEYNYFSPIDNEGPGMGEGMDMSDSDSTGM